MNHSHCPPSPLQPTVPFQVFLTRKQPNPSLRVLSLTFGRVRFLVFWGVFNFLQHRAVCHKHHKEVGGLEAIYFVYLSAFWGWWQCHSPHFTQYNTLMLMPHNCLHTYAETPFSSLPMGQCYEICLQCSDLTQSLFPIFVQLWTFWSNSQLCTTLPLSLLIYLPLPFVILYHQRTHRDTHMPIFTQVFVLSINMHIPCLYMV